MHAHAVPMGVDGPAQPDEGVVLYRLGQDEVPVRPQNPTDFGQHDPGIGQVVEDVH